MEEHAVAKEPAMTNQDKIINLAKTETGNPSDSIVFLKGIIKEIADQELGSIDNGNQRLKEEAQKLSAREELLNKAMSA